MLRFNGDHAEGTSCGSKSKNDDVCLHWETHVVQWEVARKKNAIFKVKIAFVLCFIYNRLPKPGRAWAVLCIVIKNPVWSIHRFLVDTSFSCIQRHGSSSSPILLARKVAPENLSLNQNATEKNF